MVAAHHQHGLVITVSSAVSDEANLKQNPTRLHTVTDTFDSTRFTPFLRAKKTTKNTRKHDQKNEKTLAKEIHKKK